MSQKFAQGIVVLLLRLMHLSFQQEYGGYIFEKGEYSYKIVLASDDRRTWYEAEEICQGHEGGHLVTITNDHEDENSFLNEKIQHLTSSPNEPELLWIGAKEERELFGKAYKWADGQNFNEYGAAFRERGLDAADHDYDMCIVLKSTGDIASWIEADCYETKGYICKIKGVPKRLVDYKRFGYEFDSGRYIYKFVFLQYEMLTWPEAEIYCREAEGAHLASVRNARESKFLEKNLRMLRNHFGFSKLWIGASDLYNESHFSWSDGTPVTYQRWIRGEPSGQQRGRKEDCAVITADYPHWAKWKDEYCLHHLPFICQIRVCNQRADIGFLVDSSRSVGQSGFRKSKEFIKFLLQKFKISQTDIHVALTRFSSRANTIFGFEDYFTHSDVNAAIDRMKWVKGGTRTDHALRLARNKMFLEKPAGMSRPGVPKFLMVMTDGISSNPKITALEAAELKKRGIHIMVVAVGHNFYMTEALSIASSSRDVVTARSFSRLRRIVVAARERFCGDD